MSDCFDHEMDAWDSYDRSMDEGFVGGGRPRGRPFIANPLYYHREFSFTVLVNETDKAYELVLSKVIKPVWVPKSICRQMDKQRKTVWIHTKTLAKIIRRDKPWVK